METVFEAVMLMCFGISWPISIAKALRTKVVEGKSPVFMGVVWCGYLSGVLHKVFFSMDWVIMLYFINMVTVATDFFLYFKYRKTEKNTLLAS